jgi:DNA invertase Pin-like site-specific DNA recombinase
MKAKRAALYTRVSTGEQNTEAQERALRDFVQRRGWKVRKIYCDHGLSGTTAKRPALNELLRDCRRGSVDVIVVWKFDRFARSLNSLISGLELCRSLGIDFVSVTEAVDTSLPAGELVFQMIGAVAQFERSLIAERVRSGWRTRERTGRCLADHRCGN